MFRLNRVINKFSILGLGSIFLINNLSKWNKKFRMENNINKNIIENKYDFINKNLDKTYIFVIKQDNYKDFIKDKLKEFLDNLKSEFKENLEIIYLDELNEDIGNMINKQNLNLENNDIFLIKKKNHKNFFKVDIIQFYYRRNTVLKMLIDLPTIEEFDKKVLSKFQHVFLANNKNSEDIEFIRNSDWFSTNVNLKFGIKNKDLDDNDLVYINKDKEVKLENFFLKDKDAKEREIVNLIWEHSLFFPSHLTSELNKDFFVELVIDENKLNSKIKKNLFQNIKDIKNKLRENHSEIFNELCFTLKKDNIKNGNSYIIIKNDKLNSIKLYIDNENKDLDRYKLLKDKFPSLKNNSNVYNYKYNFDKIPDTDGLLKILNSIKSDPEQLQYYQNQKLFHNKYSEKITQDVLSKLEENKDKNRYLFNYSKNCFSCKALGNYYEEMCKHFIMKDKMDDNKFYRINNEYNGSDALFYDYTPVFSIYKKNCNKPFIFRAEQMNIKSFVDFLLVSNEFDIIENYNPIKIN